MGKPRRAVQASAEDTLTPPDALTPAQSLVRVIKPEGNNVFLCELPGDKDNGNKKTLQLELAQRFRNTIWIRRGGYVLAERYPENSEEKRAEGEIVNIVRDEKAWRKQSYWPKDFAKVTYSDDEDEDSTVGKMPPSDSEDE